MLHAFTHLYQVALLPLYLPIQEQFGLKSVGQSTLLVTIMMLAYFAPSYPMGMLADRVSRKKLLGFGLLLNGLGFVGLARSPELRLGYCLCDRGGNRREFLSSRSHGTRRGPVSQIDGARSGLVGVGAGVGFFIGPLYAGWRAAHAGWRAPVLELGLLGSGGRARLFACWPSKADGSQIDARGARQPFFHASALALFHRGGLCLQPARLHRHEHGHARLPFLQQAHGYSVKTTGTAVSGIFLAAIISNPLFGRLSDRGRYWWTTLVLVLAGGGRDCVSPSATRSAHPSFDRLRLFLHGQLPMMEAALMESVPDAVRGRVFGFFITIGGVVGNLSHWLVGEWVEHLGPRSASPAGYYPIYGVMGGLVLISLLGLPCMRALRRREEDARALHTLPASVSCEVPTVMNLPIISWPTCRPKRR